MIYTKQEIGAVMKKMRLDAGLTQKAVAQKIGRSQQIVGHWESGYAQPDIDTFIQLCELYGSDLNTALNCLEKKPAVNLDGGLDERLKLFMKLSPSAQNLILAEMEKIAEKEAGDI